MSFLFGVGIGAIVTMGIAFIFAADKNNPDDVDDFTDFH
jgi:gas vesicle protein